MGYTMPTGHVSKYPSSPARAELVGLKRYTDCSADCPDCGVQRPIRYIDGNACVACLSLSEYERVKGLPSTKEQAVESDSPGFYPPMKLCPNGPHAVFRDVVRGRCLICSTKSDPREQARSAGKEFYIPSRLCSKCKTRKKRSVLTDMCTGCFEPIRPPPPLHEEHTSIIMRTAPVGLTANQAQQLGFMFYQSKKACGRGHRAPRYITSGTCTECMNNGK